MWRVAKRTSDSPRLGRRGMATVEFALVALLLMTWIFGMIDIARAFWTYQIMEQVAVSGARCMGVLASGCSSSGAYSSTAAQAYIVNLASQMGLSITANNLALSRPANCANTAGFSQVTVNYVFNTASPVLLPALSGINLTSTACYYNTQ